jgi:uncharacterized protein (DUF1330 family)
LEKKVAHCLIAQVKVNDDSWIPDYAANVHDIVYKHGGKYLSRSGNITMLEGDESTANLVALIEFPTSEALHALVNDPDYAPYAAGTIPYLTGSG